MDSTDVPPAAFVEEEPADEAGPAAELVGLPDPVIQDSVSSNEVQLPVTQFAEIAEDLALLTYSVNHDLTEEAFADLLAQEDLRSCGEKVPPASKGRIRCVSSPHSALGTARNGQFLSVPRIQPIGSQDNSS